MKLTLAILLLAFSLQAQVPQPGSVNTMAKESNRQERARNIQHFGEPDTSWMLTNAGWMRKRSQAMVATNQWNRPVSVKLVPPEIVPPEAPARAVAAKHSHYVSHHYRTRSAWVFIGNSLMVMPKTALVTVVLPAPNFTIEKKTIAPDVMTITITCKTNGLWDVETSTDLKNWTPINDWRTNNPRVFVGSPSALVPTRAGSQGNQYQFYRMKFKP